jgi:VanZ family protein
MTGRLIDFIKPRAGWLFIAWFVGILVLSVLPIGKAKSFDIGILEIRADYLYHIIIYLTGTFLAILWSVRPLKPPYPSLFWRRIAIAGTFMLLMAVALEFIQKLIPSRAFNINDIISNLIGVILGTIFTIITLLSFRKEERG